MHHIPSQNFDVTFSRILFAQYVVTTSESTGSIISPPWLCGDGVSASPSVSLFIHVGFCTRPIPYGVGNDTYNLTCLRRIYTNVEIVLTVAVCWNAELVNTI